MQFKYLYIILFILFCASSSQQNTTATLQNFELISEQDTYVAGETISLEFKGKADTTIYLYCANSYGTVLVSPKLENTTFSYTLPQSFANKSGVINWQLIDKIPVKSGTIKVSPQAQIKALETYIGPPSIEAGGNDYTMLVTIPTDPLDNALSDSTEVSVKHQFLNNSYNDAIAIYNGIAYRNINSEPQDGRIIISTECLGLNSKEYDVNVMPAIPTDFEINYRRIHEYADGNQITTLTTSELKDRYGNTVSDGTFVTFFLTNSKGYKSQTSGSTINGVAEAKFLHPDYKEDYTIKAYVEGMAESNTISINYKRAIGDFEINFSEDKRTITVGPIQSFMNQRVPDGLNVTLKITKNDILDDELVKETRNGFVTFKLNKDRFPKGPYNFEVYAAGTTKTFITISYE
jgi:hypothetical protein